MKIPYFCCIGAELKRYAKDFDFMNQVYLYKVPTDDSIDEVLAEDYFTAISDSVLQDDIVYIYEASSETLHSCRFDKQNGHITAVPLASDETLTGAVTTIIHDNLTKNRAVISDNDGKVAASEVTTTELGYLSGATSNIQTQLNNKANAYSYASNCITEIPQDIKLELNNGTLTLKKGSVLTRPDGTRITVSSDLTHTNSSDGVHILYSWGGSSLNEITINRAFSGSTTPTGTGKLLWFDTTNSIIKETLDGGSTWSGNICFPIAIYTVSDGAITSIDQVFNGFGYIGNSIFALPNIKYLIPNERNADGTLNNVSYTNSSVRIATLTSGSETCHFLLARTGLNISNTAVLYDYDEKRNVIYNTSTGTVYNDRIIAGIRTTSNGKITALNAKTPFHAVDYNDTEFIAHQAMPSDRYVNLSLGNSSTNYTMPADGYLCFSKNSGAADEYVTLRNETAYNMSATSSVSNTGLPCRAFLPVSKGDSVKVIYTLTGTTDYFKFVYANGSK